MAEAGSEQAARCPPHPRVRRSRRRALKGDVFSSSVDSELLDEGWSDPPEMARRAARVLARLMAPAGDYQRLAAAAAAQVFARRGRLRVRELAAELGVSERRLQRAFDSAIGLSPKRLARVARLQAVLGHMASAASSPLPGPSLAEVAVDCGYADQAHLSHEFRELVGVPPGAFLAEQHPLSDLFVTEERLGRLLAP